MPENSSESTEEPAKFDLPDPTKPLSNELHERFALAYAEKPFIKEAAIQAGYAPKNANNTGWKLRQLPEVRQRIAQLKAEAGWTKEQCIAQVDLTYKELLEKDRHNWKERREFVTLMMRAMGYLSDGGANINIALFAQAKDSATSYKVAYVNKSQDIDTKQVTGYIKAANSNIIGHNQEKLTGTYQDSPQTGS